MITKFKIFESGTSYLLCVNAENGNFKFEVGKKYIWKPVLNNRFKAIRPDLPNHLKGTLLDGRGAEIVAWAVNNLGEEFILSGTGVSFRFTKDNSIEDYAKRKKQEQFDL